MERAADPGAISEAKLQEWITRYADAILRICYGCLNDRAQAEDAMQDTFIKAWRHMGDFARGRIRNEKAWLTRIAVNTCRDYRRGSWFRHVNGGVSIDDLPPRMLAGREEDHDLALTVLALPEKERQAVLLYYYQGWTEQETAEILGCSIATVNRRLRKAEATLRRELEGGEQA